MASWTATTGFASGAHADSRVARITEEGLALGCQAAQDWIAVDVLVGKKLSSAQKKKAEWVDPQRGFLRVRSGRLRIESLKSLSFGPEPDSEGCEIEVPPGDYDVVVHRVAWELLDVESTEERPELPSVVLELLPVGTKGPRTKAASLGLAAARGEVGTWLLGGHVDDDGAFHGAKRAHSHDSSIVYLNLRGAHAGAMGLRFGDTLEVTVGEVQVSAPFTGYVGARAMEAMRW